MPTNTKISPAFAPFLIDADPEAPREAIVVFKPDKPLQPTLRGRLKNLQARLDVIHDIAAKHPHNAEAVFAEYQARNRAHKGGEPLRVSAIGGASLPIAKVEVTRGSLQALAANERVVAIMPNQRVHLIQPKRLSFKGLSDSERKAKATWGLSHLDIPALWPETRGEKIPVGVIDSGVYGDHPAIRDRIQGFVIVDPLGRRIETNMSFDGDGHGTHVCGTIAGGATPDGVAIGVAPEAELLVAAISGAATVETVVQAIGWATDNGASILNMSFGFDYYEPRFEAVLEETLLDLDVLPVAAIGNENYGNSSSPGNAPSALSVGAALQTASKETEVAPFSSGASLVFHDEADPRIVTKPDVVAPGVGIYSCIPPVDLDAGAHSYGTMDGTSMATPHVAGVAALLMAAVPEKPAHAILKALKDTAWHPHDQQRPDNRWGYGLIQPQKALQALK